MKFANGIVGSVDRRAAVIQAAAIAYGFDFLHPFIMIRPYGYHYIDLTPQAEAQFRFIDRLSEETPYETINLNAHYHYVHHFAPGTNQCPGRRYNRCK